MIKELRSLTMAQFIDILCGDAKALRGGFSKKEDVKKAKTEIAFEFMSLSEPAMASGWLAGEARKVKAKAEVQLFKIMSNLIAIEAYSEVRELLSAYGLRGALSDDNLKGEVRSRLLRAESDCKRLLAEDSAVADSRTPKQIRASFDQQTASLMAFFKFQIDLNTINAAQFACLIAQAEREIKAQKAIMAKR
ncbi:MAG: hypothetical protein LUD17_05275 [Bacteroidales bacterium]|nr:hypothetical protein [Bacteroidales bacterium]